MANIKDYDGNVVDFDLATLTVQDILKVYSGRPGCACGCRGNYRYRKETVEEGTKSRGYAVDKSDINEAQVKKVLKFMQDYAARTDVDFADALIMVKGDYVAYEVGNKVYVIYFTKAFAAKNA